MSEWNHQPELPIRTSPLFEWPLRPLVILRWFFDSWFFITQNLMLVGLALLSWYYLQPPLADAQSFAFGWVFAMWLRNMGLMILVAGGLHLWFFTLSGQGKTLKYDPRDLPKGRMFTFGDQTLDNIFWSLASGVTVWTAYEALMIWSFANGYLAMTTFASNPIWFVGIFLLIPIWESFYFYWIHRWLHWRPLYKIAHQLHHRNSNVGPWSGLSMHPIEHVIYLGSVLIHWAIASHPIHILFHMQYYCLTAATTHCGFEGMVIKDKNRLALGTFHHQMHHRYFECNYGSLEMPWDKFFGSFHDGTPESKKRMIERRKRLGNRLGG